jgi:predicted O-linked N-acetylglucosamine transferase (SPINDLY family)
MGEAEASFRRALQINPDYADARSSLLFLLNYSPDSDASLDLAEARQYGQKVSNKITARFAEWFCAKQPERLRIGLVSGDFRNHSVGYFLEGVLSHLDQASVELIAYPTCPAADELTARIKPHFSAWKPLAGLSDEAAARLIHSDGVHVLIDLSGHSRYNRLPVFAWKPAPVQVSWLGYFATTGITEIDYLIADPCRKCKKPVSQKKSGACRKPGCVSPRLISPRKFLYCLHSPMGISPSAASTTWPR